MKKKLVPKFVPWSTLNRKGRFIFGIYFESFDNAYKVFNGLHFCFGYWHLMIGLDVEPINYNN